MFAITLVAAPALNLNLKPPTPAGIFSAVETAVYSADRARDELFNGIKRVALEGDALSALSPAQYALDPSTSTCCITGPRTASARRRPYGSPRKASV